MPSEPKHSGIKGKQCGTTKAIATELFGKAALEFMVLLTVICTELHAQNLGGGEEILRRQVDEKLQDMVKKGKVVAKRVKEYSVWVFLSLRLASAPIPVETT